MKKKIGIKNQKYILSMGYNNYQNGIGGVDKAIIAQKEKLYQKRISYLFLFPQLARIKRKYIFAHMWEVIADDKNLGLFTAKELEAALFDLEESGYKLHGIVIHHLLNLYEADFYSLMELTKSPIYFIVHDYYTICPQYLLLKNNSVFCGMDGYQEEKCEECCYKRKAQEHRQKMQRFFEKLKERLIFIFPSENALKNWSNVYRENHFKMYVIEHLKEDGKYTENKAIISHEEPIKIAFLGQPLYQKGWESWKKLFLQENRGKYKFYYFGRGKEKLLEQQKIHVSFQESGNQAMVYALREEKIHLAFLWSIWPETYSYTYFECLAANVFVITNEESGNIAAMVKKRANGIVFSEEKDLMLFLSDEEKVRAQINAWRKSGENGPKHLVDNNIFYEVSKQSFPIYSDRKNLKEPLFFKNLSKLCVWGAKQIKKVIIKFFYER